MSKKNIIDLADTLKDTRPPVSESPEVHGQWVKTVNAIVEFCKRSNPAFKESRFRSYIAGECGPNGGKVSA